MARKKANQEPIVEGTDYIDNEPETEDTIKESAKTDYPVEDIYPVYGEIDKLMDGTIEQIERCNDYIESGMDSNGTWKTSRKEWYTYRYLLRQVPLQPTFPQTYVLPERPITCPDE